MKAVIFDKDGVLVETFNLYFEAYKKILSQIRIKITEDDIAKRYGMKGPEIIKQIIEENKKKMTDEEIEKLANEKDKIYIKLSEKKLKLLPGVKKLLIYLKKKKYKIGIASSASKKIVEQMVEVTKIKNYVDTTVHGFEVKSSKPDPEIFLKCAEKLKVKPEDCIVFEDSIHGIKAAKKAGMKSVAVTTGQTSREELEKMQPDWILNTLEDFNKIEVL
jgi:beta-phosphoglucomutase family hydrolase